MSWMNRLTRCENDGDFERIADANSLEESGTKVKDKIDPGCRNLV